MEDEIIDRPEKPFDLWRAHKIILFVAFGLFFLGQLFKIMHIAGANLIMVGSISMVAGFGLVYALLGKNFKTNARIHLTSLFIVAFWMIKYGSSQVYELTGALSIGFFCLALILLFFRHRRIL